MSEHVSSTNSLATKLPHEKTQIEHEAEELKRQQEAFRTLPNSVQNALRSAGHVLPLLKEAAQGFPSQEAKKLRRSSQQS